MGDSTITSRVEPQSCRGSQIMIPKPVALTVFISDVVCPMHQKKLLQYINLFVNIRFDAIENELPKVSMNRDEMGYRSPGGWFCPGDTAQRALCQRWNKPAAGPAGFTPEASKLATAPLHSYDHDLRQPHSSRLCTVPFLWHCLCIFSSLFVFSDSFRVSPGEGFGGWILGKQRVNCRRCLKIRSVWDQAEKKYCQGQKKNLGYLKNRRYRKDV